MNTDIRKLLARLAKGCLDKNIPESLVKFRERQLIETARHGKFIFHGVCKYKFTMPEGESTWSTNICLQAWLNHAKNNQQLDLFDEVQNG